MRDFNILRKNTSSYIFAAYLLILFSLFVKITHNLAVVGISNLVKRSNKENKLIYVNILLLSKRR